jgi:hypothetical protein
VDALAEAGFCYAQGIGCKKNLKKSAKFYRMAEAKGMSMVGNSWYAIQNHRACLEMVILMCSSGFTRPSMTMTRPIHQRRTRSPGASLVQEQGLVLSRANEVLAHTFPGRFMIMKTIGISIYDRSLGEIRLASGKIDD